MNRIEIADDVIAELTKKVACELSIVDITNEQKMYIAGVVENYIRYITTIKNVNFDKAIRRVPEVVRDFIEKVVDVMEEDIEK